MHTTIQGQIAAVVGSWEGVSQRPHRYGGIEFRVNHHEIGHIHGDRLADLPFPRRIREQLVANKNAVQHHMLPETGWVSYYIQNEHDLPAVIALFRQNYERLTTPVPILELERSVEA
jgi:hypothetical protein